MRNNSNSSSNHSQNRGSFSSGGKSLTMNNSGLIDPNKKYCIFTTKDRSNYVIASERPILGKVINESLVE